MVVRDGAVGAKVEVLRGHFHEYSNEILIVK